MSDDIRVGDRFLVEVEVGRIYSEDRALCRPVGAPPGEENDIALSTLLVAKRLPRGVKAGDRVSLTDGDTGVVVTVVSNRAWVDLDGGLARVVIVSNLTIADESGP